MDNNPTNANDLKVVKFTNPTDFTFTPAMGCMYDGRPILGMTGAPGINAGESMTLPYHVGQRLATNLAKIVKLRQAPLVDPAGIPTGVPLWNAEDLETVKNSYLTELYTESKPIAMSETDKLMEKVEEYRKMVENLMANTPTAQVTQVTDSSNGIYQDKADVIAELTKREIKFDARKSKAYLEKLIV